MATSIAVKRMMRERALLERSNPDYFVAFNHDNLLKFEAYIKGPDDSLYAHKLIKVGLEIPPNYPIVPPKATFLQYSGGRIHPNLYREGKVCLSILGTWPGEPWTSAMNINSVLITIRSLLDNEPYKHEPGQRNDAAFNRYVQYSTWQILLTDYIDKETSPAAKLFLAQHLGSQGPYISRELKKQQVEFQRHDIVTCRYDARHPIKVAFPWVMADIERRIEKVADSVQDPTLTADHVRPVRDSSTVISDFSRRGLTSEREVCQSSTIPSVLLEDLSDSPSTPKKRGIGATEAAPKKRLCQEVVVID